MTILFISVIVVILLLSGGDNWLFNYFVSENTSKKWELLVPVIYVSVSMVLLFIIFDGLERTENCEIYKADGTSIKSNLSSAGYTLRDGLRSLGYFVKIVRLYSICSLILFTFSFAMFKEKSVRKGVAYAAICAIFLLVVSFIYLG